MQKKTKNSARLPMRLKNILSQCPQTGGGVHRWIYRAACNLKSHLPEQTIFELISENASGCGRPVNPSEIFDAIKASSSAPKAHAGAKKSKWPNVNHEQVEAVVKDGIGLAELWESSPLRFDDDYPKAEEIIDILFPDNPLLCVGQSIRRFLTKPREDWRGELNRMQFIVPSPMSAERGRTNGGRLSHRSDDNTGPRKYLVIEFDSGSFDEHASILCHLATKAPLVMVLMSGNKSLHGWFLVSDSREELQVLFMRYAVSLGADRAQWTKSQMVRLPDGWRAKEAKRQSVIFMNPEVLN